MERTIEHGRRSRLERFAPLTGVLAVALIVAAFLVFPDEVPEPDEGVRKIVDFWRDNDDEALISSILFALSAIPLTWFAGSMHRALRRGEIGRGRLSHVAFAGLVILATSLLVGAALQFALAVSADDLSPAAIEALNAINVNFWFPYIAALSIFMLATAVSVLRHRGLHAAFGWTALLLGILLLTPVGFFAFLASGIWIVAAAIALFLRGDDDDDDLDRTRGVGAGPPVATRATGTTAMPGTELPPDQPPGAVRG